MNKFMEIAITEAKNGAESQDGGPFGAVIARNSEIIAAAHNEVLKTGDPTAHAEINAIRKACAKLGRFSLHDCEIYSTCLPCPMCVGAVMWAKIPKLYYGAGSKDAAAIGFDDDDIFGFIKSGFNDKSKLSMEIIDSDECLELFKMWEAKEDKQMY